jgi:hypothetical protein
VLEDEEKKFSMVSDYITQVLLAFVIDNHHDKRQFKDYMLSNEGRELMKNTMKEVLLGVSSHQKIDTNDAKGNSQVTYIQFFLSPPCIMPYR